MLRVLKGLSEVSRFELAAQFMDSTDTKMVHDLFSIFMTNSSKFIPESEQEIKSLKLKYLAEA